MVTAMKPEPLGRKSFLDILNDDLSHCTSEQHAFFARAKFEPERWKQSPWGDFVGGFWAVASYQGRVLWFNEIEDGFNVSEYQTWGVIPKDQYWCNQDSVDLALQILETGGWTRL